LALFKERLERHFKIRPFKHITRQPNKGETMELKILIGGLIISGAWFMYQEYRAEQKRKQRHQKDLHESFKANVIKFKK